VCSDVVTKNDHPASLDFLGSGGQWEFGQDMRYVKILRDGSFLITWNNGITGPSLSRIGTDGRTIAYRRFTSPVREYLALNEDDGVVYLVEWGGMSNQLVTGMKTVRLSTFEDITSIPLPSSSQWKISHYGSSGGYDSSRHMLLLDVMASDDPRFGEPYYTPISHKAIVRIPVAGMGALRVESIAVLPYELGVSSGNYSKSFVIDEVSGYVYTPRSNPRDIVRIDYKNAQMKVLGSITIPTNAKPILVRDGRLYVVTKNGDYSTILHRINVESLATEGSLHFGNPSAPYHDDPSMPSIDVAQNRGFVVMGYPSRIVEFDPRSMQIRKTYQTLDTGSPLEPMLSFSNAGAFHGDTEKVYGNSHYRIENRCVEIQ
jgi:hypothetical protein